MSLSKRHLSSHQDCIHFDVELLGRTLEARCPEIIFALLLGSAKSGTVSVGSDVDIALFLQGGESYEVFGSVEEIVNEQVTGAYCDVGYLNKAEPIYRFEALKGTLLFARDQESYLHFYSLTCREYESQLYDYERQFRYRTEAA